MSDFKGFMKAAVRGEVLIPALRAAMFEPNWQPYTVDMPGWSKSARRKPDGWFHPSTHPMMTERQLYYYLTETDLEEERVEMQGILAMTAGTFWHAVLQHIMLSADVIRAAEVPVVDEETRSRGHVDGDIDGIDLLEIKTMNINVLNKVATDDPANITSLATSYPGYYAQAQEYLRMLDRPRMILLAVNPVYPFTMREFHIPADAVVQQQIKDKYLSVREAVAKGVPPEPCCSISSPQWQACFARTVCSVGLG